jgi:hypothetical protein
VQEGAPKPELFLCGIIMYGNQRVAFVEDKKNPTTSPAGGRTGGNEEGFCIRGLFGDGDKQRQHHSDPGRAERVRVSLWIRQSAAARMPRLLLPRRCVLSAVPFFFPTPPAAPPSPRPSRPLPSKGPGEPPSGSNKAPPSPVPPTTGTGDGTPC